MALYFCATPARGACLIRLRVFLDGKHAHGRMFFLTTEQRAGLEGAALEVALDRGGGIALLAALERLATGERKGRTGQHADRRRAVGLAERSEGPSKEIVARGTGGTYGFHGYWAKDWTAFDPNFGTEQDFAEHIERTVARDPQAGNFADETSVARQVRSLVVEYFALLIFPLGKNTHMSMVR